MLNKPKASNEKLLAVCGEYVTLGKTKKSLMTHLGETYASDNKKSTDTVEEHWNRRLTAAKTGLKGYIKRKTKLGESVRAELAQAKLDGCNFRKTGNNDAAFDAEFDNELESIDEVLTDIDKLTELPV